MKNFLIALQITIGFILGVLVVTGGAVGAAYVMLNKMAKEPPKPVYPEEQEANTSHESESAVNAEETETTAADLPANGYRARVVPEIGLYVREEPNLEANRIGGLGHQWEIVVLQTSEDGEWEKIRIPDSGEEGWVKAGNLERID